MAKQRTNYNKPDLDMNETTHEERETIFVRESGQPVRVRSGAGTSFGQVNGQYLGKGEHEIVEIAKGLGSKKGWGRLADGRGWVALDFVEKVSK